MYDNAANPGVSLCVFDHLEAWMEPGHGGTAKLVCHNPTRFDADVRVMAESASAAKGMLGQAASLRWPVFAIRAGETIEIEVEDQPRARAAFQESVSKHAAYAATFLVP